MSDIRMPLGRHGEKKGRAQITVRRLEKACFNPWRKRQEHKDSAALHLWRQGCQGIEGPELSKAAFHPLTRWPWAQQEGAITTWKV